jgi:hypothetical protein
MKNNEDGRVFIETKTENNVNQETSVLYKKR